MLKTNIPEDVCESSLLFWAGIIVVVYCQFGLLVGWFVVCWSVSQVGFEQKQWEQGCLLEIFTSSFFSPSVSLYECVCVKTWQRVILGCHDPPKGPFYLLHPIQPQQESCVGQRGPRIMTCRGHEWTQTYQSRRGQPASTEQENVMSSISFRVYLAVSFPDYSEKNVCLHEVPFSC